MITLYLMDEQGIFTTSADVDPMGPVPRASTTIKPPELTGHQVGRWIGDSWEVLAERPASPPLAVVVPHAVPSREALQVLLRHGHTEASIGAAIDEYIVDPVERESARIDLRKALTFERYQPLVVFMGEVLALDLDALFIETVAGIEAAKL